MLPAYGRYGVYSQSDTEFAMKQELTKKQLFEALKSVSVEVSKDTSNSDMWSLKLLGEKAVITLQVSEDEIILKVSRGWLDYYPNMGNVYEEFCKQWNIDHPGVAAHLWYTRDGGCVPICRITYSVPGTKREMMRLVRNRMFGVDMQNAICFFDEIDKYARK